MKTRPYLKYTTFLIIAAWLFTGCVAKQKVDTGLSGNLEDPGIQHAEGVAYLEQENLEGAETRFARALSIDEHYLPALLGMAAVKAAADDTAGLGSWHNSALGAAQAPGIRQNTRAELMEIYLRYRPENWQAQLESLWQASLESGLAVARAAVAMGTYYQDQQQLLRAVLFFRKAAGGEGESSAVAAERIEALHSTVQDMKLKPGDAGSADGEKVTRDELAALIILELKLDAYLAAVKPLKYNARGTPAADNEAPAAGDPEDISTNPWEQEIKAAIGLDLRGLELFPGNEFRPADQLNRAALALVVEDMLARIKDEPLLRSAFIGSSSPFPDVAPDHFAFNAMVLCATRNFLSTDLDGAFRPENPATGVEALQAIGRLKNEINRKQVTY